MLKFYRDRFQLGSESAKPSNFPNPHVSPSPLQGAPEALPYPILSRLSSTSQMLTAPRCGPLRRATAAHWGRGKRRGRKVAACGGARPGDRSELACK
jgi:hypothetical protein